MISTIALCAVAFCVFLIDAARPRREGLGSFITAVFPVFVMVIVLADMGYGIAAIALMCVGVMASAYALVWAYRFFHKK